MMISKTPQTFFFDEAGFTGNNLLDPEQPVFVYAGVAIDEIRASQIHAEAVSRFHIHAKELKGAHLIKYSKGRNGISWILNETREYSHIMVANKEYALAGKFFEYVFEPVLSKHNSLFYAIDFHRFVATLLYIWAQSSDLRVKKTLTNFMDMMKSLNPSHLESVLAPLGDFDQSHPMGNIFTFALCHQERIKDEIRTVRKSGNVANWPLELSASALHWLLVSWGEEFEVLDVYCDNSKPIQGASDLFDTLIGREDKAYLRLGSRPSPSIIYNLSRPINFMDSKESCGIQIADVVSSSLAYAYRKPEDEIANEWISLMKDVPSNQLIPDPGQVDVALESPFVNSMVLLELVNRTVKGLDLFDDLDESILSFRSFYFQN